MLGNVTMSQPVTWMDHEEAIAVVLRFSVYRMSRTPLRRLLRT